jgi:hypothetical protein
MLFSETAAVYLENHSLCEQCVDFLKSENKRYT